MPLYSGSIEVSNDRDYRVEETCVRARGIDEAINKMIAIGSQWPEYAAGKARLDVEHVRKVDK